MKIKLLIALTCILITGTVYTQAQQLWAVTPFGGTFDGGTIIRMNPDGTGFEVEFSYQCSFTSGCKPMGNLVQASNGQLYGTCFYGGQTGSCTVDRYDPVSGIYYDIFDFNITDGDFPRSGLVEANNGKLYGVASAGGPYQGVLYSIDILTNHQYNVEYGFSNLNGTVPWGCPILKNGILYGLTAFGGSNGFGVLYSYNIATDTYTVLYHLNVEDGTYPKGSLYEATDGFFYGMTSAGGANSKGTIFSYDPVNNLFSVLHSFSGIEVNGLFGSTPEGTFMQAVDGKLYGVTKLGGVNNAGVIFSYDITQGIYTKLYDFVDTTGSNPTGDLYQSPNLRLYGTAANGGAGGVGVIFSYDIATGIYTDIVDFTGANGSHPAGGFIMVDLTTGTAQLTQDLFSVYPNPVQDEINIAFGSAAHCTIKLTNTTGEILFSTENYSAQSTINTGHLPKGIYFVEVREDNGKISTQKVVKM